MRIKFIVKVRAIKQAWEIDSLSSFKILSNGLSEYLAHKED